MCPSGGRWLLANKVSKLTVSTATSWPTGPIADASTTVRWPTFLLPWSERATKSKCPLPGDGTTPQQRQESWKSTCWIREMCSVIGNWIVYNLFKHFLTVFPSQTEQSHDDAAPQHDQLRQDSREEVWGEHWNTQLLLWHAHHHTDKAGIEVGWHFPKETGMM